MPFLAILRDELRGLRASWLVRLWFGATALLTLLTIAANWKGTETAELIPWLLFPYLVLPWSLVVMVLSVAPVSGSRMEAVADGFLSRPITRYEYLLAAWSARVVLVLGVYLVVMIPAVLTVGLADRAIVSGAVTFYGCTAALGVVALVLTFLVSMGFFLGTILRNQWLAVVMLVFLWFPVNLILNTFSLEELSPISLTRALPELLQRPWTETRHPVTEPPPDLQDIAQQANDFFAFFGGQGAPAPKPERHEPFFDRDQFKDFRLTNVVLGYGLPTLLAITLATLVFCWRDL